ncbi:MAG: DUF4386 domain-containing protein [Candidatus Eisenbacteria bacterium]|uniref:DUF4386 domain-containing protein n=1 Tax=Eiseniibacteriota bacterium TaxID=2212470 RepID=A0A956RPT3_UNCEI|nr:DUF4386 domain-containing protein [Candidatus Eisenbacteria bacterium]
MEAAVPQAAQAKAGRLAGILFLFVNAAGVFAEVVVRGSLLQGDAMQVAQSVADSERLYRLGIAVDLTMLIGGLVLIWALYVLLGPVHRDLAFLAVLLRTVETAATVAATVASLVAVQLLGTADYLRVFAVGEVQGLSRLARIAFGLGQDVGFIFLGLGSAVFAYLLLRSHYVPRILASWGVVASLLLAAYNLVAIVVPSVKTFVYIALVPMGIYEIGIGLWLVIKGVMLSGTPARAT